MKTTITKRSFLRLAFVVITLFTTSQASAVTFADNNEDENGEEIIINPEVIHDGGGLFRSPEVIPIIATFYKNLSIIHIEMIEMDYSITSLSIRLTNLSTGQASVYTISSPSSCTIPVLFGMGYYYLEVRTDIGNTYSGVFTF